MITQQGVLRAALWLGPYMVLILTPLGLALLDSPPASRGFWVEFGVALGFIGLAMLSMQFLLTARFQRIATIYGQDAMLQFHRQAGIAAAVFAIAHPVILFLADPAYTAFLDPRVNLPRFLALSFVIAALILLITLSLWRKRLGISYEWWRVTHALLAFIVLAISLIHTLMVGHYISVLWKQLFWVGLTGTAMFLLFYVRVFRPLMMRRTPYRVMEVRRERGQSWTLVIKPEGHSGLKFRPGQFAWLTLSESPFSLRQHPFSFSSSALKVPQLEITIKELGDFTSTIGAVSSGSRAYLEGPFGAFDLPTASAGIVFIAGGIGITPIMSMLRTLRDASDRRPLTLIYGSNRWDEIIFREDIEELQRHLNLQVVHVLKEPPSDWTGETGWISARTLERHLPQEEIRNVQFFVCGPEGMMNTVEQILLDWQVPLHNIHTERFDIDAAGEVGRRQVYIRRMGMALGFVVVAIAALFASAQPV